MMTTSRTYKDRFTSNKDAIAALESQIKSGEWVSSVTSTTNGIVVTLGNGTSYTITNGEKGEAGKDGVTPKIAVNNDKIQVSYDNGTTWTDLISLQFSESHRLYLLHLFHH